MKIEKLYDLLFENRPVRYFFDVAPALRDLMLLGKIVHEISSTEKPGPYDRVVVDAPATGHALFLFRTPKTVQNLTRLGHLFDRAGKIFSVLTSRETTAVHIVTLGRPLVITETLELLQHLKELRVPLGEMVINRLLLTENAGPPRLKEASGRKKGDSLLSILASRSRTESRETKRLYRITRLEQRLLDERREEFREGETTASILTRLSDWYEKGGSHA